MFSRNCVFFVLDWTKSRTKIYQRKKREDRNKTLLWFVMLSSFISLVLWERIVNRQSGIIINIIANNEWNTWDEHWMVETTSNGKTTLSLYLSLNHFFCKIFRFVLVVVVELHIFLLIWWILSGSFEAQYTASVSSIQCILYLIYQTAAQPWKQGQHSRIFALSSLNSSIKFDSVRYNQSNQPWAKCQSIR